MEPIPGFFFIGLIVYVTSVLLFYGRSMQVSLLGVTLVVFHLNLLNWFHFLILVGGSFVVLIDSMIFSITTHRYFKGFNFNCFSSRTTSFWYSLPAEHFPVTYYLIGTFHILGYF